MLAVPDTTFLRQHLSPPVGEEPAGPVVGGDVGGDVWASTFNEREAQDG